ncbi:MAG: cell division protein SepF [Chthonomonas sp.]|nr:cell division protein SepF [Chthonomonas sp.]
MEELELHERPGFFGRLREKLMGEEPIEDVAEMDLAPRRIALHTNYKYAVTVRRQIISFQDAVAAADGLKRGEQQVLNLTAADTALREKIKDFMCGVNYAEEGTWEELGDNIFLLCPPHATVEVAPASPRMAAVRN